jgi:hypothetical protein
MNGVNMSPAWYIEELLIEFPRLVSQIFLGDTVNRTAARQGNDQRSERRCAVSLIVPL